ncbi:factor-independent urate hydroxylase [Bacillus sp. 165]|uniref:factor-independent urate hydroxylase n=1 Tax=Bacillus sp. 165 TaxID=1529117 RepID=UPI001AD993DF|nr:urate oxidase [Bacillus sp. 165]MBO9129261.1 urate oxidase [Bacillus sp. 165]
MDQASFTKAVGWVFERSSWIAEQAWEKRPFSSLTDLHYKMKNIVQVSSLKEKLALLRAHPDLAARVPMANASIKEQNEAGLNQLSYEEYKEFIKLNKMYTQKFGFPFIMAVRGQTKETILITMRKRIGSTYEVEVEEALHQVYQIAGFRLDTLKEVVAMRENRTMYYGKGDVYVYRTYAKPLTGIPPIPESHFRGRDNIIFGMNVKVALKGEAFFSSFTEGDNRLVVATDSMKNFIQRHLAQYEGANMEGFLHFVCKCFLDKYSHISAVEVTSDEIPFDSTLAPAQNGLKESKLVFRHSRNEYATATMEVARTDKGHTIVKHSSGVKELQLIKVSGNSFYGFIRDEYTTLPEAHDRPLFIYLNLSWKYNDAGDAIGTRYVAAEQVRDIAQAVFHELDSRSIQHLIWNIGLRVLERFPQLDEIQFESNNRTWETVVESIPNSTGSVFTEPRPPFGFQVFVVTRNDLAHAKYSSDK